MSEALAGSPVVTPPPSEPRDAVGRGVGRPRGLAPWMQIVLAAAAYAAFTIWFTWPVATDLDSTIYGAPGDLTGSIANLRELVDGRHNPFLPGTLTDFNAPEGQPIAWALNLSVWPAMTVLYALAIPFGATASFTLFTGLGYLASALGMFLLIRRLTGNPWIALLIGFAYGYYPFAVVNGAGHNFFVHGWVFVLIFWRMLELSERPTRRNAILAGLAVIVAVSWAPYFILIGGVLYATLAALDLVSAARRKRFRVHLKPQLVAAALIVGYLGALSAVTLSSAEGTLREHPEAALTAYSARPLEYLLPPAGNLLLGDTTGPYLQRHLHGSNFTESTLYLGVSILALALVALVAGVRRRSSPAARRLTLISAAIGIVALAFSAPPKVSLLGELVPMPSWFVFQFTSTWRVYSRFVMVVMLAACLLAALGLHLLSRGRRPVVRAALLGALTVVIPLDLYVESSGDTATTRLQTPPIYDVLRAQPPGILAQYPLYPSGHGDYQELFYQQAHGKPILNGYADLPQEGRDLALANLEDPSTAGRLAALGVRYVLVPAIPVAPPVTDPGDPGRGFRLIAESAYGPTTAKLFRVTAPPDRSRVALLDGFDRTEGPPGGEFRWMTQRTGTLEVAGMCNPCVGTLRFTAVSFGRPRRVMLRSSEGRVIAARRVVGPTRFVVPVRFRRRLELTLATTPGPEPIAAVLKGSADSRSVSVQISDPRFTVK